MVNDGHGWREQSRRKIIGNETRKRYTLVRNTAILEEIVLTIFLYQTDGAKNG
jgi:hypothetical protein